MELDTRLIDLAQNVMRYSEWAKWAGYSSVASLLRDGLNVTVPQTMHLLQSLLPEGIGVVDRAKLLVDLAQLTQVNLGDKKAA